MSLVSANYLFFIAIVLLVYSLAPSRVKNAVLLVASLAFAALSGVWTLAFLLVTSITTFLGGKFASSGKSPKSKTFAATLAIVFNIALLCAVKYYGVLDSIAESLNTMFNFSSDSLLALAVPLGMSFYTLQCVGYVLDCLWQVAPFEKNFFKYLLFTTYFPALTSGPINRYRDLSAEFLKPKSFNLSDFRRGAFRICWGFFLKLVIAERAGLVVNAVYSDHEMYRNVYVVLGVMAFAVQLYADFSGCMEVALGTSLLFGISLPENFNSPYMSRTIREYWQRWHITLGTYLRDYLYYPLLKSAPFVALGDWGRKKFGKKRGKKVPVYIAMVILWFAVGYWHGGVWKYIIGSGLLHCFYIVSGMLAEPLLAKMRKPFNIASVPYQIFQGVRTFVLVLAGFVFFRAANVPDALAMIKALFSGVGSAERILSVPNLIVLLVSVLLLCAVDIYKFRRDQNLEPKSVVSLLERTNIPVRIFLFALLALAVLVFGMYGLGYDSSAFIYARI